MKRMKRKWVMGDDGEVRVLGWDWRWGYQSLGFTGEPGNGTFKGIFTSPKIDQFARR